MSRAFVKEPDGDESSGELPDLPLSRHPNYVTARGLAQLRSRLDDGLAAQATARGSGEALAQRPVLARLAREIRYLVARLESAILVAPPTDPVTVVAFGTRVRVALEGDSEQVFEIVGEDEADPGAGLISWTSPLARALDEAEVGDLITWPRPSGDVELEVLALG